jgi:methionyl aminopeptidase
MQFKKYTESHGYGVVRELVGHGLGQNARRPEMPNYGESW